MRGWSIPKEQRASERREALRFQSETLDRMERKGYIRAFFSAQPLRRAGIPVEMATLSDRYSNNHKKTVPFAPSWAVGAYLKMRYLKVDPQEKRKALEEANRLGRAGPLVEALIVADRMMR